MTLKEGQLKQIVEAALLAAGQPLSLDRLQKLFDESQQPDKKTLRAILKELTEEAKDRGVEIKEVASGFRYQVKEALAPWLQKLWEERPSRYSRALLETLALIAYKQPITRADIEDVRGVAVSPNIIRTLLEREWIQVAGYKDVPGRPALFGTTKLFLDDFNLRKLSDLPPLDELSDLEEIEKKFSEQLDLAIEQTEG